MICPFCKKSVLFKQRAGGRCGECKREFAFEPKGHALMLHDRRFRKAVEKLGRDGMRYTADQLRHALSRKPVAAQRRMPAGAVVFLTTVLAVIAGAVSGSLLSSRTIGVVVAIAVVAVGAAVLLFRRRVPFRRTLPMKAEVFRSKVLDRWHEIYGERPEGLVDPESLRHLPEEERPLDDLAAVVVSPVRDVLACLLANHVPRDLRVGLLPTSPPFDAWETKLIETLRRNPRLPVLLLHDASAADAFLARDLPLLLRLDPSHRVYDLGLNPKRSMEKSRLTLGEPLSDALRGRLVAERVGEDSAGARPIRRGRAAVTDEEIAWLQEGNHSPILAVSPANLVKRVRSALDKLASKRAGARGEARAAQAVGFLTWPE